MLPKNSAEQESWLLECLLFPTVLLVGYGVISWYDLSPGAGAPKSWCVQLCLTGLARLMWRAALCPLLLLHWLPSMLILKVLHTGQDELSLLFYLFIYCSQSHLDSDIG
jgi:hypothetical protein